MHIDVKKLGKIPDGGGWRVLGRGVRPGTHRGLGYDYVHAAIDDFSGLGYAEILPDEKGTTCAGFWLRAAAWFATHGINVRPAIALFGHADDAGAASDLLGALQFGAGAAAGPIASIGAVNVHSMSVAMLAWAVAAGVVYLVMVSRSSAARQNAQEGLFLTLSG